MKDKAKIYFYNYFFLGLIAIGSLSLLFYIFFTYPVIFHSDSAAFISLAKERMEARSFFPKDWNFSTGLSLLNPALLIPFFAPLFGYSILSRSFSVVLYVLLLFLLVAWLFKREDNRIGFLFSLSLLASGVSSYFAEHIFGQASYIASTCLILAAILLSRTMLDQRGTLNYKYFLNLLVLFILIFISSFAGLSSFVRYVLPYVFALTLVELLDLKKTEFHTYRNEKIDLTNKIVLVCTWLFSSVSGIFCHRLFITSKGIGLGTPISFVTFEGSLYNLRLYVNGFLYLFSGTFTGRELIFPFSNLLDFYRVFLFTFLMFGLPAFLVCRFDYIKNRFFKTILVFHIASLAVTSLAYILTNVSQDIFTSRYFIFPIFLSLLIFGMFINQYFIVLRRYLFFIVMLFIPFYLSSYILLNYPYGKIQITQGKIKTHRNSNYYSGITEFLRSNKLTYGYATFWNAGVITSLSSWNVQVNPIQINSSGLPEPYYWLSSSLWYEPSNYEGRTFLLLADGEDFDLEFFELYFGETVLELKYPGYQVLVYDFNIADKLSDRPSYFQASHDLEKPLSEDALKIFKHKEIVFFYGWRDFKGLNGEEKKLTKNARTFYIKNQEKDVILKIKGFTEVAEGSKINGLKFYLNDELLDRFKVSENPNPFIYHYIIKADRFEGKKWANLRIELDQPVLRGGKKKAEGVFIDEAKLLDDDQLFYGNGWYRDFNKEWKYALGSTSAYFKKPDKDLLIKISMKPDIESFHPVPIVILSINGKRFDELIYPKDFITNFDRHYLLSREYFKNIQSSWIRIDMENIINRNNSSANTKENNIDMSIEKVKNTVKENILFGKGWYPVEVSKRGRKSWRWTAKRSVAYVKNLEKEMVLKIEGTTSVKFFNKPLKVIISLSGEKIDEFLLPVGFFSRVKSKITGKLFSRTYNVNPIDDDREWRQLVIEVDQSFIPDDIVHSGDKRELGLLISNINVE